MKKVLFATTALVMTAGIAAAEVTLGGSANMGVKYNDGVAPGADKATLWYELDFDVKASGETDGGIGFGASLDLDGETGGTDRVGGSEVHISGVFGKVIVGSTDPATDDLGIGDIGFDGIGIDDVAEAGKVAGGADIRYEYSFDAISFVATADSTSDDFSVGVGYDAGSYNVGVAYEDTTGGTTTTTVTVGGSFGDASVAATYTDNSVSGAAYGIAASMAFGAVTVSAVVADNDAVADMAFGIGGSMDLGGGAKFAAGVGRNGAGDTVADAGFTFGF